MSINAPKYSSGEIILSRDHIKYDSEDGEVEYTVTKESPEWDSYLE